ncbi:hypothetical protein DFJ77DRAFT_462293 [Powellomyces hirtus]|nr:hypothetical protein DFJ77DRAFT_462293 [Powellomyces hirtus]
MEAPLLHPRPTIANRRPVPPPPSDAQQSRGSSSSLNGSNLSISNKQRDGLLEESLKQRPTRRRTEDVQSMISRAPSVPSTIPVASEHDEHDQADGIPLNMETLHPDHLVKTSQSARDHTDAKSGQAYAYAEEPQVANEPPPPYNLDYAQPVAYPDAKTDINAKSTMTTTALHAVSIPMTPSSPSITLNGALETLDDKLSPSAPEMRPSLHRRCYSDCLGICSAPLQGLGNVDETLSLGNPSAILNKSWHQKFSDSRGHASDTDVISSDDDAAHKGRHLTRLKRQGNAVAEDSGSGNPGSDPGNGPGTGSGPDGSDDNGVPGPGPESMVAHHARSESYSNAPVAYPHLADIPHSRNPLHPAPTSCELREEWEPGLDPAISSRSKISSLFTGKGSKETSWRRAWVELAPEDGWKLTFFDVMRCRESSGDVSYQVCHLVSLSGDVRQCLIRVSWFQKKPMTAPFQTYSLRHASVSPPRTGYGSSRTEILCVRLVSGKYVVLSFPSSTQRSDWSKGVKSAIEMASRFTKGGSRPI